MRCTKASAGRGRFAAALAASVINPLSSTEITRNIATRTLRRARATTITTRAISRNTVGPSTVQNTSQNTTQPGWAFPKSCRTSRANRSVVSIHCHCCVDADPQQQIEGKRRRGQANEPTFPRRHGSTLRCPHGRVSAQAAPHRRFARGAPSSSRSRGHHLSGRVPPGHPAIQRIRARQEGQYQHLELCRFAGDHLAACSRHAVVGAQARRPHHRPTVGRRRRAGPSRPTSRIPGCTSRWTSARSTRSSTVISR